MPSTREIRRLLVANRGEIAIRVFRAATELGLTTIAIYAEEDKLSLHRFKADEAYHLGPGASPIGAYLDIPRIVALAQRVGADAIHPGYGFLSESPAFARACAAAGILFIGPEPATMEALGNKVSARRIAEEVGVPVIPASGPLPDDDDAIRAIADGIGYPLMLKASWGGGGRGMRPITGADDLITAVRSGKREAKAAFGRDEVYLEKRITRARHIEVQILGDRHGTLLHLFERDCSIQRRNQKVIERAPAPFLDEATRQALCDAALRIGRAVDYVGAGTVEFLMDMDSGRFFFIEVNPRIQVEHTVTEAVTGIDIVKAQIRVAMGLRLGHPDETGVPPQSAIRLNGHAIQCRITTEDPANDFIPDFGRITAYRGAFGYGVRIDGGTAYANARVSSFYDPLLEKIICWAPTADEAAARMVRALREYRIRGVATNLVFLMNILTHPDFRENRYTTRFIDDTPALRTTGKSRNRASRLLTYIADVSVNGHPDTRERPRPPQWTRPPELPAFAGAPPAGSRQILEREGAEGLARWIRGETRVLLTDTTMRDAHQSLLATRMRTIDMVRIAESYAHRLPGLFSIECWGGATFDASMRFLMEDPWERLAAIRAHTPNLLTQMLLRGANGVGYTNYPDNVVRHFIREAAKGIDVFRIFDCFNWVENMRVAIDAVVESGKVAQGAVCYTGDLLDPDCEKYTLGYYVDVARRLKAAGCHMIAVKDMAGLLKPGAARALFGALRDATDLPLVLHMHDTSGAGTATLLAAIDAGADGVDVAMDAMSGTTSQPSLGTLVQALRNTERATGVDSAAVRDISAAWEKTRRQYTAFESHLHSGASEVYLHEMPGGQFTNLKEQARSLGLASRWNEVARAYHEVNLLFGDIIKVTPSSKAVGDMALMMVTQGLTAADLLDSDREISFPQSVVAMLHGDLGQPVGGWPAAIQRRVLGDTPPITVRPSSLLPEENLDEKRAAAETQCSEKLDDRAFASYLMYPEVFRGYVEKRRRYGPVGALPTPVFFYGMEPGDVIDVTIEQGKTLVVHLVAISAPEEDGTVRVFFELNGQPRTITTFDRHADKSAQAARMADPGNGHHVAAPMPGVVTTVAAGMGQRVEKGDVLAAIEAMKIETTVTAPHAGVVAEIATHTGATVRNGELLVVLE